MRDRKIVTRSRLQAVGAMAAFAFVVGLSAPESGVAESATTATMTGAAATSDAATIPGTTVSVDSILTAGLAPPPSAPAPEAPAPPSAPTVQELHPVPVTTAQQRFTPTQEQLSNAKAIVDAGKAMGLPPRAWTIAVATSLQESNLHNIGHLGASNDHDSLGLFQQRPSTGWGTPAQILDPAYAATAFYNGLLGIPNWDSLPLTVAAQEVQVSAYPDHYAKHEAQAGEIVEALYGQGPYAGVAAGV
jgi:hypothetical protein